MILHDFKCSLKRKEKRDLGSSSDEIERVAMEFGGWHDLLTEWYLLVGKAERNIMWADVSLGAMQDLNLRERDFWGELVGANDWIFYNADDYCLAWIDVTSKETDPWVTVLIENEVQPDRDRFSSFVTEAISFRRSS